jgi:hypothetical protein
MIIFGSFYVVVKNNITFSSSPKTTKINYSPRKNIVSCSWSPAAVVGRLLRSLGLTALLLLTAPMVMPKWGTTSG